MGKNLFVFLFVKTEPGKKNFGQGTHFWPFVRFKLKFVSKRELHWHTVREERRLTESGAGRAPTPRCLIRASVSEPRSLL